MSFISVSSAQSMQDIIEMRNEHQSGGGMKSLSFGSEKKETSKETIEKKEQPKEQKADIPNAELSEDDEKLSEKELWEKYKSLSKKGKKLREEREQRIEDEAKAEKEKQKEEPSKESDYRTADYDEKEEPRYDVTAEEKEALQEILDDYKNLNKSQGPMHSRSYGGFK